MIKKAYVGMIRLVGRAVSAIGLLAMLERRKSKRWAHWLLSLFAIHDVDRMIALDVPWLSLIHI